MSTEVGDIGGLSAGYFARLHEALDKLPPTGLERVARILWTAYKAGARVFIAGNGGSASTASHMACDLGKTATSPFEDARRFCVTALTDNMPIITAWANDASYDRVFSEQLRNLARPGDVLVVISASGRSPNVLQALSCAREMGVTTIGLLGFGGGLASSMVDEALVVDSNDYGVVEDAHLVINHVMTAFFQQKVRSASGGR